MLIPIRLAPPSSPSAAASAAAAATTTPAKQAAGAQAPPPQQPEEWSLIELNGTLSASLTAGGAGSSSSAGTVGLGGLPLGQLTFDAPDKPVLVIGAHKLEGEIKALPKPFLIMQKQRKRKRSASAVDPVTPGGAGGDSKRVASGLQTPVSGGRATPTPSSVDSSSLASPSPAAKQGHQNEEQDDGSGTEYAVVGVVRHKLLFQNRPKPIVSRGLIR